MSNTKTTKRALLTSVMALMLCFAMLTGTTFAWFTDTETSSGNKIVAGNLDVELRLWNGSDATVAFEDAYTDIGSSSAPIFGSADKALNSLNTLWEPGKTQVAYLAIANAGNLELKYMVNLDTRDTDAEQNLYEAMSYVIVPDASYGSDIVWADIKDGALSVTPGIFAVSPSTNLSVDGVHYFALVIHMDENAGNEYQGGQVEFDINVLATQLNAEEDAFGKDYDASANFDGYGFTTQAVDHNNPPVIGYNFGVYDVLRTTANSPTQLAYFEVPSSAVDPEASELKVTVEKLAEADDRITVAADQFATTFDVTVEGILDEAAMAEDIKVTLRVPAGLTGVKLYHNDTLINGTYNSANGTVVFFTKSFSPYTVVYDSVATLPTDTDIPVAAVTNLTETYADKTLAWTGWGGFNTNDPSQKLETVFSFQAPHDSQTVQNCTYKDWLCDYYVEMDKNVAANAIALGGNYGGYGWVGFNNPEAVAANESIGLLGSLSDGVSNLTYSDVAGSVQLFYCGVARATTTVDGVSTIVDAANNLTGATFKVVLRVINPENTSEYYDVNTITYKFGDTFANGVVNVTTING